jgi:exonuclease III
MGVKEKFLEVEDHEIGDYFISLVVRQRTSNFRWELMTVYGSAQHDMSRDFIAELSRKCMSISLPVVMGGDFNLIRQTSEKSNGNINQGLIDRFNMFIDLHQLQEIRRNGPGYTWSNKQLDLVMVTLDRVLVSTEWEGRFPLCFAWSNTRVGSDHWPIFLDSGEGSLEKQICFYFEK